MLEQAADYETLRAGFRWAIPERYNIAAAVCDDWAARAPERAAIVHVQTDDSVRTWSYLELARASSRFANALAARGIGRGDRVALLLPQAPETAIAHLAIYRLGAIAVPLAALFGVEALTYRLTDSGARAIVTNAAGLEKLAGLRGRLPDLRLVVSIDGAGAGAEGFETLLGRASDRFETVATTPDDPALMIYTSGTTGQPKGVLHGHRVLLGHMPGIEMSQDFLGQAGDILWTPADWAWAGGLLNALFPALLLGVPVIAHAVHKFDPEHAFRLIARQGVRNAFIPPTALKMLRQVDRPAARFDLKLRSIGSAGEALGREAYDWVRSELGLVVNEFYGQTECNAVLGSCAALGVSRAGAIGKPIPGHEVAVIDEAGAVLPPETLGQIAVRRPDPVMFLEYWNRPEATAEKFVGDWMTTGDQGMTDADGYVRFVGRDDDVITSASYRIGPGEIEDCLLTHPAVALSAAVGKPDPLRTEIVKAYIVLNKGYTPGPALEEEIRDYVRTRLSAHEYPREIAFIDDLPMTTTGKVVRRELRERARDETDRGG
ncbi:AMP-binding protein [Polymorphum gilvum]|uniref:Putative acetyl-coenzyme A synthetase (AcsA-like) n=1 Tax=Polymorphum gilvum (strain LMG 25793 / CGMCC 1.9160 / SL003B-26A1) TaxID=991905 RepID=F2J073_POLGS|nr:AMP-binding protein [Polymorphum gilvum]ADZ68608.1 Putative acetyl-coenzyme A synthetase (AcsA-like) [Polymorphum gilvum SL003B-26A1]